MNARMNAQTSVQKVLLKQLFDPVSAAMETEFPHRNLQDMPAIAPAVYVQGGNASEYLRIYGVKYYKSSFLEDEISVMNVTLLDADAALPSRFSTEPQPCHVTMC